MFRQFIIKNKAGKYDEEEKEKINDFLISNFNDVNISFLENGNIAFITSNTKKQVKVLMKGEYKIKKKDIKKYFEIKNNGIKETIESEE